MKCKNPYVKGLGQAYPCGQCLPCRLNRRRVWTHRMMLEAAQYTDNSFITLTYNDDNLPDNLSLNPKHTQDWLKRLRKAFSPNRFRFYLVGEYGDVSQRPHYHAALFNFPTCERGRTLRRPGSGRPVAMQCCPSCRMVQRTWGFGDVDLGILETSSAQYVAGYVTKKMTSPSDPRLYGRHPEFARMSNRPGIGADAMHEIASQLMTFNLEDSQGDVPSSLRHGSRLLPLGRYLRRRLRLLVGKPADAPVQTLAEMAARLQILLENYEGSAPAKGEEFFHYTKRLKEATAQKLLQVELKSKLIKKRGSI